jgi:hypothetical protein
MTEYLRYEKDTEKELLWETDSDEADSFDSDKNIDTNTERGQGGDSCCCRLCKWKKHSYLVKTTRLLHNAKETTSTNVGAEHFIIITFCYISVVQHWAMDWMTRGSSPSRGWEFFSSPPVQTNCGTHPTSYPMGTRG